MITRVSCACFFLNKRVCFCKFLGLSLSCCLPAVAAVLFYVLLWTGGSTLFRFSSSSVFFFFSRMRKDYAGLVLDISPPCTLHSRLLFLSSSSSSSLKISKTRAEYLAIINTVISAF
jgi:hypothetical protein